MKQNQQFRGLGLVLLVIALCVLASALTQQGGLFSEEMSHQEFMVALENKMIEAARVNQNRQTPTGSLDLLMYDGDRKNIAVSDVIAAEELLKEYRIDYQLVDVPQDNYLMTIILPIGLSAVVIVFIIMYMNARIGNSGGNNTRMMNFSLN